MRTSPFTASADGGRERRMTPRHRKSFRRFSLASSTASLLTARVNRLHFIALFFAFACRSVQAQESPTHDLTSLSDYELRRLQDFARGRGSVSRGSPVGDEDDIFAEEKQRVQQPRFPPQPPPSAHGDDVLSLIPPAGFGIPVIPKILTSSPGRKPHAAQRNSISPQSHHKESLPPSISPHPAPRAQPNESPRPINDAENNELDAGISREDAERLARFLQSLRTTTTPLPPSTPPPSIPPTLIPTMFSRKVSSWPISATEAPKQPPSPLAQGLPIIIEQENKDEAIFIPDMGGKKLGHAGWTGTAHGVAQAEPTTIRPIVSPGGRHSTSRSEELEEKVRRLNRQLTEVLSQLKRDKEADGALPKTSYSADGKRKSSERTGGRAKSAEVHAKHSDRTPLAAAKVQHGHATAQVVEEDFRPRSNRAYVTILREGFARQTDVEYTFVASITLIRDHGKVILVDTGLGTDINGRTDLITKLSRLNIAPPDVDYVITTHGHADHAGNTNEFPDSIHFQGHMVHHRTKFNFSELFEKDLQQLTPNVALMRTPGHTPEDISVVVRNTDKYGTIVVAGDTFIAAEDFDYPMMWRPMAWNEKIQEESRKKLLCEADYIVPGHGKAFKVKPAMKARVLCQKARDPIRIRGG